jgi:hypothetical protein
VAQDGGGGSLAQFWVTWACSPPAGLLFAAACARQLSPGVQPPLGPWLTAADGWPLRLSLPCVRVAYAAAVAEGVGPAAAPHLRVQQQSLQGPAQHSEPPPGPHFQMQMPQPAQQQQQQQQQQQPHQRMPCGPINPNTLGVGVPLHRGHGGAGGPPTRPGAPPPKAWQAQDAPMVGAGPPASAGPVARPQLPDLELSQKASGPKKRVYRSSKAQVGDRVGGRRGAERGTIWPPLLHMRVGSQRALRPRL